MLCSNENELSTPTGNNMDKSHKHTVEWKQPIQKSPNCMIAFVRCAAACKTKLCIRHHSSGYPWYGW